MTDLGSGSMLLLAQTFAQTVLFAPPTQTLTAIVGFTEVKLSASLCCTLQRPLRPQHQTYGAEHRNVQCDILQTMYTHLQVVQKCHANKRESLLQYLETILQHRPQ